VTPPRAGIALDGADADPTAPVMNSIPMACYTSLFNASGQPAISIPAHVSAEGLPIGVQIAAPPWGEDLLIRVASQLEAARPWAALPEL